MTDYETIMLNKQSTASQKSLDQYFLTYENSNIGLKIQKLEL